VQGHSGGDLHAEDHCDEQVDGGTERGPPTGVGDVVERIWSLGCRRPMMAPEEHRRFGVFTVGPGEVTVFAGPGGAEGRLWSAYDARQ
jgi:hypothetical protein